MPEIIRFTKQTLDTLPHPAPGTRVEYSDQSTPDLRIRVTSTGAKSFCVFKRTRGGPPGRLTLGSYPAMTIDQARTKAKEAVSLIAGGADPAQARRISRGEYTFSQLFNEYIDRHAKINKRTWAEDVQRYEQYLKAPFGTKKLSLITQPMVRKLLDSISTAGHPIVANRVKALISTVFNRGIEWGHATVNPAIGVRSNPENSRDRFLNGEELTKFLTALNETPDDDIREYVLLSLLTGARRSNVLGMSWAAIDFSRQIWTIPGEEFKNGTPLLVPLTANVMEVLRARQARNGNTSPYVFPGTGTTGHLVEPKRGWTSFLKRAGIVDLHLHDLRRTLGSWQAISGSSLIVIGKTLGHKSQQSTQVYARLHLDPVRASMETATEAMLAHLQEPEVR